MGDITDWMFESGMLDMPDPFDHDEPRDTHVKCRYCGKSTWWHHTGVRWALVDVKGKLHNCRQATADEFPEC